MTSDLAHTVTELFTRGLSDGVRQHCTSLLLNAVAAAIGACRDEPVEALLTIGRSHGGEETRCLVPGRRERLDPVHAALVTGFATRLHDFDDEHLATMARPGAVVLGAALGALSDCRLSGAQVLDAIALGAESQIRIASAMAPWHGDAGWDPAATAGPLGAAVTAGLLWELSALELANAIAIASSMTLGHREAFGTTVAPLHAGKAAANGVFAAALARRGFTGSLASLEGPRGFFRVLSPSAETDRVTADFGKRWDVLDTVIKIYPCEIVSYPAVKAGERLSSQLAGRQPHEARIYCHPAVLEFAGEMTPRTMLAAQVSTAHGVSAALIDGAVGLEQYEDARVNAPDVRALRGSTTLIADEDFTPDSAVVEACMADGTILRDAVTKADGVLTSPLPEHDLNERVTMLVERAWSGHGRDVIDAVRNLSAASSCSRLATAISGGAHEHS